MEPKENMDAFNQLNEEIERLAPSGYLITLDRGRPYDGQPHTLTGERGKQLIYGLTMRDLRDCFVRACYDSSGLTPRQYPPTIYDLPWEEIDPIAIVQNLACWVERYMGIYPNISNKLTFVEDSLKHWLRNYWSFEATEPKRGEQISWFVNNCMGDKCPLCEVYSPSCEGCPLADRLNGQCCEEWRTIRKRSRNGEISLDNIRDMIDRLKKERDLIKKGEGQES